MSTWAVAIAIMISAYLITVAIHRIIAVLGSLSLQKHDPTQSDVQAVSAVAAILIAGHLANPKHTEQLESLRKSRNELLAGQIHTILIGDKEMSQRDFNAADELEKEISKAVAKADPFEPAFRGPFVDLAWSLYREVKVRNGREN